jgi:hypothetical protein
MELERGIPVNGTSAYSCGVRLCMNYSPIINLGAVYFYSFNVTPEYAKMQSSHQVDRQK